MGHSTGDKKNKRTLAIAAVLLVGALIAVYGFNVSWRTLAPFAFLAFFVWMHTGGHSMHGGGHGGQGDGPPRDEHAGHTPALTSDSAAPTLAPDTTSRPLDSSKDTTSGAREDTRRHDGC